MKFREVYDQFPEETKKIIDRAYSIYQRLSNVDVRQLSSDLQVNLLASDYVTLSFFLSCLKEETVLKRCLEQAGLSYEGILKQCGIYPQQIRRVLFRPDQLWAGEELSKIVSRLQISTRTTLISPSHFWITRLYCNLDKVMVGSERLLDYFYQSNGIEEGFANSKATMLLKDLCRLQDYYPPSLMKAVLDAKLLVPNLPARLKLQVSSDGEDNMELSLINLTAANYVTNPAVGRKRELNAICQHLLQPEQSSVLLKGPSGVGKTALAKGLAYYIQKGYVPSLRGYSVVSIDIASLLQGTELRGAFEKKVKYLLDQLVTMPNVILFVDELHNAKGAGSSVDAPLDLMNMLKPYLDHHSGLRIIGATTDEEYEQYIAPDRAFSRRFSVVEVAEPRIDDVAKILDQSIPRFEEQSGLLFAPSGLDRKDILSYIASATDKGHRPYQFPQHNPALAFQIIDQAFGIAKVKSQEQVTLFDLAEAISQQSFLNKAYREQAAEDLVRQFSQAPENRSKPKIYYLANHRNNNG